MRVARSCIPSRQPIPREGSAADDGVAVVDGVDVGQIWRETSTELEVAAARRVDIPGHIDEVARRQTTRRIDTAAALKLDLAAVAVREVRVGVPAEAERVVGVALDVDDAAYLDS